MPGGRPAPFGPDRWRYPTLPDGPRAAAGPLNQAPGGGRPSACRPQVPPGDPSAIQSSVLTTAGMESSVECSDNPRRSDDDEKG